MKYLLSVLLFLIFGSLLFGIWYGYQVYYNPHPSPAPTPFSISPRESASSIISHLKSENLIRSEIALKIYLRLNSLSQKLKPGGYQISAGLTPKEVIDELIKGPKDIWITIPEGWRREQIAARFKAVLSGPGSLFNPDEFIRQTATLEGRLFPDTYLISQQMSTSEIIRKLTDNFNKKTSQVIPSHQNISEIGYTAKDILIIASLVEREAKSDADRNIIAGILIKRYTTGWPLQVDASVQYGRDTYDCRNSLPDCNWWQPLTDTGFKSAYNTYLQPGLPPAPICNPGLAAITAASNQNNAQTPYWFYLHDPDGTAHFARDLATHQLNIDKYLHP